MKKKIKKATIALFVLEVLAGAGALAFVIGASIWANKPRGVRIRLEDED